MMISKKASTRLPINRLLSERWSGRAYDPDRSLTSDQILTLLEAARWAPSCFGDEPWRYIVCNKATDKQAWEMAFACLKEGNRAWAAEVPVLLLICANSVFDRNGDANRWGQYDTGASAMSVCVQATDMGLMVHQMGGFEADRAQQLFAVPTQYTPMSMMAIGYQKSIDDIPEEQKERELAPRQRRPLGELFYRGKWQDPIS